MAFIHDDQIEEVARELLVDVSFFFGAGDRLIKRQVDFVGFVHLSVRDLRHGGFKWLEIVDPRLVHQNVPVGEKQNALLGPGTP